MFIPSNETLIAAFVCLKKLIYMCKQTQLLNLYLRMGGHKLSTV